MQKTVHYSIVLFTLVIGLGPYVDWAAAQGATAAAPATLGRFLGFPTGLRNRMVNRRGRLPGLEKKPPMLGIADPANLESEVPAIKAAAKIKQQEDLAKQKIKAIRYLAKIGCGLYDETGEVTQALVAAMGDPTEKVRLAAIQAVEKTAGDGNCEQCNTNGCCNKDILEKLAAIAYERDESGCWQDPSEEVRAAAVSALQKCCNTPVPLELIEETQVAPPDIVPRPEGPAPFVPAPEAPAPDDAAPEGPATGDESVPAAQPISSPQKDSTARLTPPGFLSSRRNAAPHDSVAKESAAGRAQQETRVGKETPPKKKSFLAALRIGPWQQQADKSSPGSDVQVTRVPEVSEPATSGVSQAARGSVRHVDLEHGIVQVSISKSRKVAVGARVKVYHNYITGRALLGTFEVVRSTPGTLLVRPTGQARLAKIGRGDAALVLPSRK